MKKGTKGSAGEMVIKPIKQTQLNIKMHFFFDPLQIWPCTLKLWPLNFSVAKVYGVKMLNTPV